MPPDRCYHKIIAITRSDLDVDDDFLLWRTLYTFWPTYFNRVCDYIVIVIIVIITRRLTRPASVFVHSRSVNYHKRIVRNRFYHFIDNNANREHGKVTFTIRNMARNTVLFARLLFSCTVRGHGLNS